MLARWLITAGLATERDDGMIVPTPLALELGDGIVERL